LVFLLPAIGRDADGTGYALDPLRRWAQSRTLIMASWSR
jgi:hypothetical protein